MIKVMSLRQDVYIEHYTAQVWQVKPTLLNNQDKLLKMALKLSRDLNLTVVNHFAHQFKPHGITLILVIAESHLAIHTWPEFGYCHIDIISCSTKTYLDKLEQVLQKHFKTTQIKVTKILC